MPMHRPGICCVVGWKAWNILEHLFISWGADSGPRPWEPLGTSWDRRLSKALRYYHTAEKAGHLRCDEDKFSTVKISVVAMWVTVGTPDSEMYENYNCNLKMNDLCTKDTVINCVSRCLVFDHNFVYQKDMLQRNSWTAFRRESPFVTLYRSL